MLGKRTALVVDKNTARRALVALRLTERRYTVTTVASVEAMVPAAERPDLDLVVVHWSPDWDAVKPLFKSLRRALSASVVVAGLQGKLDLAVEFFKAGACDCLVRPVTAGELVDVAENAVRRRFLTLRPWYDQSVRAIAAAIGLRDVETEEHCERVSSTTVRLCQALGIRDEEHLETIRWGAFLHDVGKVGIPDAILHKNGPLDDEERRVMRRHPEIGRNLLERVPFLQESIPLVLYHHERFDGQGYPRGMRGDAIPLEARAVALADSVDAMLSNRSYRDAQSWVHVVAELQQNRGRQFDPRLVDIALEQCETVFADYDAGACSHEAVAT